MNPGCAGRCVIWSRAAARSRRADGERGQISLLILGFTAVALMLVVGGVDATAVQLARTRMLDAADGAALDAADALDEAGAYGQGLDEAVRLTDATVQQAAAGYLAAQPRPSGVSSWGWPAAPARPTGGPPWCACRAGPRSRCWPRSSRCSAGR